MNGILAAVFWSSTFLNTENSILNGLEIKESTEFETIGLSMLEFEKERSGYEIQYLIGTKRAFGPLQATSSFSITDRSAIWFGYGFTNTINISEKVGLKFNFIPGFYHSGNDVDLGGWIMFRSGLEVGIEAGSNFFLSISYDHRSSGDIWPYNPGLESIQIRLTKELN